MSNMTKHNRSWLHLKLIKTTLGIMTSPKGTGKIINIKCTEVSLPEFPNLLFGTHFDGSRIFDATYYLQSKDPDIN